MSIQLSRQITIYMFSVMIYNLQALGPRHVKLNPSNFANTKADSNKLKTWDVLVCSGAQGVGSQLVAGQRQIPMQEP
jgi:hypothetical protein